jgi:hypothetical protein
MYGSDNRTKFHQVQHKLFSNHSYYSLPTGNTPRTANPNGQTAMNFHHPRDFGRTKRRQRTSHAYLAILGDGKEGGGGEVTDRSHEEAKGLEGFRRKTLGDCYTSSRNLTERPLGYGVVLILIGKDDVGGIQGRIEDARGWD